jgi:TRAP-type C4-dicarboxylate transport system substrate-binding protein
MLTVALKRCAVALLACAAVSIASAEEIRIATLAPADGDWMQAMVAGANRIRELTEGRVTLKFRAGGVAGSDSQVLRKIRIGDLQGGAFSAGALSGLFPGMNLYGIPLIFRSLDEVDYVRARLDPKLTAGLAAAGFVSFGFSEGGFSNLLSNVPVSHVDDLKRQKVWVPDNDSITFEILRSMQLSPVPLELSDALLGLERGLVDVVAASPMVALVLQWHTKVKYRTDLPISYSMGVLAIDSDVFYGLEARDQAVLQSVLGQVMAEIDASSRSDNIEAAEVMTRMGITTVPVDSADVEGWRQSIAALYPEIRGRRDMDADLFDEMLGLLEDYRSSR